MRAPRGIATAFALGAVLAASGCFEASYVFQAAQGQLDIACSTRPLNRVLDDPDVDDATRALLAEVPGIKEFAKAHGLVPTGSYQSYVELDRPVAVWVVSASPPLEFEPLRWTFPIVGSVPYLGWFDRADADKLAEGLRAKGWDVDIRGARAYSTLGWFSDPVLSSMLDEGPGAQGELANTILHESLHATLYVNSQSVFNESVANFVGDTLADRYLEHRFGQGSVELEAYRATEESGQRRAARLHRAYAELDALYRGPGSSAHKLREKARLIAELESELHSRRPINNAMLAGFRTYHSGREELERLLATCGGEMRRFVTVLSAVRRRDFTESQQEDVAPLFEQLIAGGCR